MSKTLSRRSATTWPSQTIRAAIVNAISLLGLWLGRLHDRHELRELDIERIRDMGLAPVGAKREAAKPFWRA
jgi:uncharacterized protein YjiS (DUF1127 family)